MGSKKVKGTKKTFVEAKEDKGIKTVHVKPVKFLTENQHLLHDSITEKEITITSGQAGVGKTYLALAAALKLLGSKYKKIILVKSGTTLPEEEIGFLKGSLEDKMQPFMMSYVGNLQKLVGERVAEELFKSKVVEVLPLAYIRGLSIDNSIVLVDEIQNIDPHTFKTIITRIGSDSKYIFMGDMDQIDRKNKDTSCLRRVLDIFKDSDIVGTVEFGEDDCVRNPIIKEILQKLKENDI
jgi:phosphate starvation-inducible PhoH-like protein